MKIRRFVADSFQEAMNQAKVEMGRDAIILHSRKFKQGGFLGLFARQVFEITVAVDEDARTTLDRPVRELEPEPIPAAKKSREVPAEILSMPEEEYYPEQDSSPEENVMDELRSVKEMVEDIKQKVEDGTKQKARSRAGQILYKTLISNQVDEKLAVKIVKTVEERMEDERRRDISVAKELGIQVIMDMLKKPKAIEVKGRRARIVALIGPTGVGKTTTIAKLAANFSLLDKKKVGLITLDTYRIAAVEQLKTYAEIIGVPLEVVFNPEDLKAAIKSFAARDIVFIDTAGRSPRNETQMEELSRFLEVSEPDEIILVLSATTRTEELIEAYRKFNVTKIDKIVFTKLDETTSYGQILSTVYKTRSHISYITNGQNVPDDIELPDELLLAKLILGDGRL